MRKWLNKSLSLSKFNYKLNYNTILKNNLFKNRLAILHKVKKSDYKNTHNTCLFIIFNILYIHIST